jgi:hypothetical protein
MRIQPSVAIVVALGISSSVAFAANKPSTRRAQEKAAQEACLLGDPQKGAELLVKLYVETHEPTYIYNQARCFEQNHRYEDAIDLFREYLRKASDLPAADKADVDQHIAECQGHLNQKTTAPVAAPAAPPTVAPVAAPAAVVSPPTLQPSAASLAPTPETGLLARPSSPEPVASPPVYTKWWFWTAVGVVVVAGAGTALVLSNSGGNGTSIPNTPLGNQPLFQ